MLARIGCRLDSALSEGVEEGQQCVAGLEPQRALSGWRHTSQSLFLGLQIRLDVHVGSLRTFVAQPERDDGDVHSGLQKVHRRRVAQDVRRDALGRKGGARLCCLPKGLLQEVVHAVARQSCAAAAGKGRSVGRRRGCIQPAL